MLSYSRNPYSAESKNLDRDRRCNGKLNQQPLNCAGAKVDGTSTRRIGVSQGTWDNGQTSLKLYDYVNHQFAIGLTKDYHDIELNDIDGDKIVMFFKKYMELLSDNFIPIGWYKEDGWEQNNPVCLKQSTVVNYFSNVFADLKGQFPDHPYLSGEESKQVWWGTMKSNLLSGYSREVPFLVTGNLGIQLLELCIQ